MASAVLPTPTDPFIRHLCAALTPGSHTTSPSTPNFASYTGGVHTHASPASFDPDHGWDPDMPYELRALEVALTAVTHTLDLEAFEIERAGYPAAQRMSREVTNESLEEIAALKDRLGRLTGRTTRVKAEFEKILGDDADLADLYLTRRAEESGVPLPPQPPGSRPASAGSQGGTEDGSSSSVRVPSAGTEGSTGPEGAASRRAALYRKTSLVMRQVKPSTSLTKRQSSSFDGVSEGEASAAVAAVVEVDKPIKEEPEEEEEEEEVIITHPFGAAAFIDPVSAAQGMLHGELFSCDRNGSMWLFEQICCLYHASYVIKFLLNDPYTARF